MVNLEFGEVSIELVVRDDNKGKSKEVLANL